MEQSTTNTTTCTPCASLAAIGAIVQQRNLFGPIRDHVKLTQKTVKHTPIDKLSDAFITILAGAQGMVEVNTRLRTDPVLQRAFGRDACAEQSVVQDTFDACTAANVTQLQAALATIYRAHSQGNRHDYAATWQVLDVDMSGLPCGPKAAFATKGYFAKQRNRRGRQLGRVLASRYHEVVTDQLFDGATQLTTALQPLVTAAEGVLDLAAARRIHTLVRIDAGGGSRDDVKTLVARDYRVLVKDYSSVRSARPRDGLGHGAGAGVRARGRVHRGALPQAQWAVGLQRADWPARSGADLALLAHTGPLPRDKAGRLLAYVPAYDQRGGGVETAFKDDKQGLGHSVQIILNQAAPLVRGLVVAFQALLAPAHIAVSLGET